MPRRFAAAVVMSTALASLPCAEAPAQTFDKDGRSVRGADPSLVPGFPDVLGEYLQIPGAPSSGTPAQLATATFLRLRAAIDAETPRAANVVIVAMPGFASTPAHWLYLGAQLVHKAAKRGCDDGPCRLEVWVVQRRGANLADTAGGRVARARKEPGLAVRYYFGDGVLGMDPKRPGKWPLIAPQQLVGRPGAKWKPLTQRDLAFVADWSFEVYAGDVDRMIALVKKQSGSKNIFLAGHSQGGGFVANYAGRKQSDGLRGYQKLAGLIFLDGGPSAGTVPNATPELLKPYLDGLNKLRRGEVPVVTDTKGALGNLAGAAAAAAAVVINAYYAFADPRAESIFGPRSIGALPSSPAGDAFLSALRLTYRARAGMSIDVDPLPGAGLQAPILTRLGEGLGRLDFKPLMGTEKQCDTPADSGRSAAPALPGPALPPPSCIPAAAQIDPQRVYGWLEGGGKGAVPDRVGKAQLWMDSQAFAPSRSNIKPMTLEFAESGAITIDASNMVATNFYPSERYDSDMQFLGRFHTLTVHEQGVDLDIDKDAIAAIPVYVARQSQTAAPNNPFPRVTDFTEINKKGTFQTEEARKITPFDPAISVALNFHTDFVSVDDSLEGQGTPGRPGVSAVANTLIDWVLRRSQGRAIVPTPGQLSVVATYP